jgi:hypothetical protein
LAKELADPHRPLQRQFWIVERVGWALLTLIIIWAIAGGAGGGILSQAQLQGPGIQLDYDRFARRGALTPIELKWEPVEGRELSIELDAVFVDRMKIDFSSSGLQPVRTSTVVRLDLGRNGQPGRLILAARPIRFGTSISDVRIAGQSIGTLKVFVFP